MEINNIYNMDCLEGIGKRVAQDIGGVIRNKRIDLFFDSHSNVLKFGRQTLEVWEVADIDKTF